MNYVTTVTVNQWRIKDNAEKGLDQPTICVNTYEYRSPEDGGYGVTWGPRVGDTRHFHDLDVPTGRMIYDPVNKTPCGASCWMQIEGEL